MKAMTPMRRHWITGTLLALVAGTALATWPVSAAEPVDDAETPLAEATEVAETSLEEAAGSDNDSAAPPPCEYCLFESGQSGFVEAGGIAVSDDNYGFGRFNGLDEEGFELLLNAEWMNITEDGRQLSVSARNLGIDSRSVEASYGRQGRYELYVGYHEIPTAGLPGARTPFIEQNGFDNVLVLPGTWVDSGSTSGMTNLGAALHPGELELRRRRSVAGLAAELLQDWEFDVKFQHDEKDGNIVRGGSFLTTATQLLVPRDFTTDSMDASAVFNGDDLTVRLAYYLSAYSTTHDSLIWENPFTPIFGADAGQLALEPDNRFQQVSGSLSYRLADRTMLHVQAAMGTGTQDETFLPLTINDLLGATTLPSASLDGEVETSSLHARLVTRLGQSLSVQANFRTDERDNRTPERDFTQVITDTYVAPAETSRAHDWDRRKIDLGANYRPFSFFRVRAGIEDRNVTRNHSERDETSEKTLWVDATISPFDVADLRLKYITADRDGSAVIFDEPFQLDQNPLLRRYHIANRERESFRAAIDLDPLPWMIVTLTSELSKDRYPESGIGLRNSTVRSQSLDASFLASAAMRYSLFVHHDNERAMQAGSEAFAEPDWFALNNDETWTTGFGASYDNRETPWSLAINLAVSEFEGESDVDTTSDQSAFPDLVSQMYRADARFTYRLGGSSSLTARYIYEEYDLRNWQLDSAGIDSVPGLLAIGTFSPDYDVSVLMVSYRWNF